MKIFIRLFKKVMVTSDLLVYIIFFAGTLVITLISNHLLLRFSKSLGIRNNNDILVRWSNQSKPSLGGISLFVGFLFSVVLCLIKFPTINLFADLNFVGLFIASSISFSMGLADDAYNTRPYLKLFVQIFMGLIFLWTNVKIDLFHIPIIDSLFTVIWVVTLMNSINMLDNMDGISATTVFFALLTCLISCYVIGNPTKPFWLFIIVSMLGSLIGFLSHNIYPSKLFMGDSGSQFLGLFVSFFSIKYLWNLGSTTQHNAWISIIITLVALTPAAADTLTVVINRMRAGKSPMIGGKDHTTHHLVYAGYSDLKVWIIFSIIGFFSFLLSILIIYLTINNIIIPNLFFILFFIIVFLLLYRNTLKFKASNDSN